MASIPSELEAAKVDQATVSGKLLVMLAPTPTENVEVVLAKLDAAFPGTSIAVGLTDIAHETADHLSGRYPNLHLLPDKQSTIHSGGWVLTSGDYLNLYKLAKDNASNACLLLGPDSSSLDAETIGGLGAALTAGADLAVPRYQAGPREGLVNAALLYPVNRAIFGGKPRFPLALDLGLSIRAAERLATVAQRFTTVSQNDAIVWPVAEITAAGFNIVETHAGRRVFPQPEGEDLNTLLAQIAGSLFTEVETHAAFWQRVRVGPTSVRTSSSMVPDAELLPDVQPMLESFQIAYKNLHEIWSLVLPPNSLLALKRLSQMPAESFRMSDSLWARTVYDFVLAYRLRTINRGHLLGALTPLYLAWVASHILLARSGVDPERHVEEVAQAFETDKPYLVSRWRWPDRFNP